MNTKNVRPFDEQGRVSLTRELVEVCKISEGEKVAICSLDEKRICLKKIQDAENYKIIGFAILDQKWRIMVPKKIREATKEVTVYLLNGDLILEEMEEHTE